MTARPAVFVVGLSILLLCASDASAVKRRAFVTSVTGTGDLFSWPGSSGATALARADSVCRARAAAGGLPNPTTYRAWLSTSTTDAYCHVQGLSGTKSGACGGAPQPGGGPWYRFFLLSWQVTPDLATLTGPERVIYRPVVYDEFDNAVTGYHDSAYWTGTKPDGTFHTAGACEDWISNSSTETTPVGTALGGSYSWSLHTFWGMRNRAPAALPGTWSQPGGSGRLAAWLAGLRDVDQGRRQSAALARVRWSPRPRCG